MSKSALNWFRKYFYFSKATLCIQGLILGGSIVSRAVSSVLFTYLTMHIMTNFQKAAVITNVLDGGALIMVIYVAYLSRKIGHFHMVVFTTSAYTTALALLWISSKFIDQGADAVDYCFYWAAVLLTIGQAGLDAALPIFLYDQYISGQRQRVELHTGQPPQEEKEKEEEEEEESRKDLWSLPWFLGAVPALCIPGEAHWRTVFLISMLALGVCFVVFLFGKLFSIYSVSSSEETAGGGRFGVTRKENGHRIIAETLAVSFAFIAYSLVEATGSTFFFERTTFLDRQVGNFTVPLVYLTVVTSLSKFISSQLWRLLIPKQGIRVSLVKIGCGVVLSVLCCVVAWRIEIRRKSKIEGEVTFSKVIDPVISMSILELFPQFSLLGLMRGLAEDGLVEFFAEQVVDDDKKVVLRYYGCHAFNFVLGIGTLLTAVSILGFRRTWLDDDIYRNRLDKYYRGLAFLGVANFGYYLCVASYLYMAKKQMMNIPQNEEGRGEIAEGRDVDTTS